MSINGRNNIHCLNQSEHRFCCFRICSKSKMVSLPSFSSWLDFVQPLLLLFLLLTCSRTSATTDLLNRKIIGRGNMMNVAWFSFVSILSKNSLSMNLVDRIHHSHKKIKGSLAAKSSEINYKGEKRLLRRLESSEQWTLTASDAVSSSINSNVTNVLCRMTVMETIISYEYEQSRSRLSYGKRKSNMGGEGMNELNDNDEHLFCVPLVLTSDNDLGGGDKAEEEGSFREMDDMIPLEDLTTSPFWSMYSNDIRSGAFIVNVTNVYFYKQHKTVGVSTAGPSMVIIPTNKTQYIPYISPSNRQKQQQQQTGTTIETTKRTGNGGNQNDSNTSLPLRQYKPMNMKPPGVPMTVLFVHISTSDARLSYDSNRLVEHNFAPAPAVNFVTQYDRCSFGKVKFLPATLSNITALKRYASLFRDGVIEITIPHPIGSFTSGGAVANAAVAELKTQYGIDAINTLADRVVFCIPPGISGPGWAANAGVRHWRVQMNGEWCMSLTGLMHELGHTAGHLHAHVGESNPYGDRTGYMGSGYTDKHWPKKCFNAFNHYEFQWYSDRTYVISDIVLQQHQQHEGHLVPIYHTIHLAAFVDYDKLTTNITTLTTTPIIPPPTITPSPLPPPLPQQIHVLIAIDDTYFLQYNRAKSFNNDTEQWRDAVVVTEAVSSGTDSLAGLQVRNMFQQHNYRSTHQTLRIEICSQYTTAVEEATTNEIDVVVVSISLSSGTFSSFCPNARISTSTPVTATPITASPITVSPSISLSPTAATPSSVMIPPQTRPMIAPFTAPITTISPTIIHSTSNTSLSTLSLPSSSSTSIRIPMDTQNYTTSAVHATTTEQQQQQQSDNTTELLGRLSDALVTKPNEQMLEQSVPADLMTTSMEGGNEIVPAATTNIPSTNTTTFTTNTTSTNTTTFTTNTATTNTTTFTTNTTSTNTTTFTTNITTIPNATDATAATAVNITTNDLSMNGITTDEMLASLNERLVGDRIATDDQRQQPP